MEPAAEVVSCCRGCVRRDPTGLHDVVGIAERERVSSRPRERRRCASLLRRDSRRRRGPAGPGAGPATQLRAAGCRRSSRCLPPRPPTSDPVAWPRERVELLAERGNRIQNRQDHCEGGAAHALTLPPSGRAEVHPARQSESGSPTVTTRGDDLALAIVGDVAGQLGACSGANVVGRGAGPERHPTGLAHEPHVGVVEREPARVHGERHVAARTRARAATRANPTSWRYGRATDATSSVA